MTILKHAKSVVLTDQRVAVCGDWHGNIGWARMISRALRRLAPDVTTILHLGDWCMPPTETDEAFAETSIDRIYVRLGNHEPWGQITPLLSKHPGEAVRISQLIWLLPRPARLTIGGRCVLSLGGAASVDRESRGGGLTWWPDEAITDADVAAAIAAALPTRCSHMSPRRVPPSARSERFCARTFTASQQQRSRRPPRLARESVKCGTRCVPSCSLTDTCTHREVARPRTVVEWRASGATVRRETLRSST